MKGSVTLWTLGLAAAAAVALTGAQTHMLGPGDTAPPFTLVGSDGKTYSLADLEGKTVVLAWFVKAFTGG